MSFRKEMLKLQASSGNGGNDKYNHKGDDSLNGKKVIFRRPRIWRGVNVEETYADVKFKDMTSLRKASIGAPQTIEMKNNPRATVNVQSMMRCTELTLGDNCSSEGSITTAVRLLGQLREELSANAQGAFRVGFISKEAAVNHCHVGATEDEDGTMWQKGDVVTVEGLRLFIVRDKVAEAYALAKGVEPVSDEEAMDWAMALCVDSVAYAEAGDIPVRDEFVFWSCGDGKDGTWWDGLPGGRVSGRYFLGSVRGALMANPQKACADMWLALGLGNCTVEDVEGQKLVQAKSILKEVLDDPEKAEVVQVIAERPMLA